MDCSFVHHCCSMACYFQTEALGECCTEYCFPCLLRNLTRAEEQIGELSAGLDEVDKEVAVLREKLNRSTKEAVEVEFHLNKAKETMSAAESLVTKLEGEYKRWSQQVGHDDFFDTVWKFKGDYLMILDEVCSRESILFLKTLINILNWKKQR